LKGEFLEGAPHVDIARVTACCHSLSQLASVYRLNDARNDERPVSEETGLPLGSAVKSLSRKSD
jgi:hypothetical protein